MEKPDITSESAAYNERMRNWARKHKNTDAIDVEMKAGAVVIWLGATWHAGCLHGRKRRPAARGDLQFLSRDISPTGKPDGWHNASTSCPDAASRARLHQPRPANAAPTYATSRLSAGRAQTGECQGSPGSFIDSTAMASSPSTRTRAAGEPPPSADASWPPPYKSESSTSLSCSLPQLDSRSFLQKSKEITDRESILRSRNRPVRRHQLDRDLAGRARREKRAPKPASDSAPP